jgi:ribokinase
MENSSGPRILVIGSANVDMVMGLPRLPEKGETVTDGVFLQTFGGKGANQAVAARRAGAEVSFLCCLGDDDHGRAVAQALTAEGIDMSWTAVVSDAATGAALVMYDKQGANYLAVAPGSNYRLEPEHVAACMDGIENLSMILLQYEIPERTIHAALRAAEEAGIPVLFNHAPAKVPASAIVPGANCGIVVNEIEASMLTDMRVLDPEAAFVSAHKLHQLGFTFAIVTLGKQGACLVSDQDRSYIPAIEVVAVDTTAAGDCFCGALAAALVEGLSLPAALQFANVASSLCVQRAGAQPSIPYRAEINQAMATMRLGE